MNNPNSFDELYHQIRLRKVPFLVAFFVIVTLTYGILYALDFYPEPVDALEEEQSEEVFSPEMAETEVFEEEAVVAVEEDVFTGSAYPIKVVFDALDKEVSVLNPDSRDVAVLDNALLSGVVRHPDSADFSEDGNILILGHSSYLPNVFNKNFQAFNGIQGLQWGDIVRVQSADREYIYRVQEVYKAKASEVLIPDTPGEARLTLATCNSFGSKDDRFVVEAVLIDSVTL